ncbi:VOC family protein [Halovulum sp. GXIMD14793]
MLSIDHLVFGTSDLAAGTEWMTDQLGVAPGGGGVHPLMGTHNSLWRLGDIYLEVIAIDPQAADPGRPRWYGLDNPEVQAGFADHPRPVTWVAQTTDLQAAMAASPLDPGPALQVTRGDLRWTLTVPTTGHMNHRGVYPTLIEWPEDVTQPQKSLPENGLRLSGFTIHGRDAVHADLGKLGAADLYQAKRTDALSWLEVTVTRPSGQDVRFDNA